MIGVFDGDCGTGRFQSRGAVRDEIAPLAGTDLSIVIWSAAYADICMYDTKVGVRCQRGYDRWWSRTEDYIHNLERLYRQGTSPLNIAIEAAHEWGMKLYASNRICGPHWPPLHVRPRESLYFHPGCRCQDRDGSLTPRFSLASPLVRERLIEIYKEMVEMGADGVHFHFNRAHPWVIYENLVVQEFIRKDGRDPRRIPVDDPAWLDHQASYITQFVREVRAAMDQMEQRLGRRLETSYHVADSPERCREFGLDLKTWVDEGLVDVLIPTNLDPWNLDFHMPSDRVVDIIEMAKGKCLIYPDQMPRRNAPQRAFQWATKLYGMGADGLCCWDVNMKTNLPTEWAILRQLGHREDIPRWQAEGLGKDFARSLPLERLDDYKWDPYHCPRTNG